MKDETILRDIEHLQKKIARLEAKDTRPTKGRWLAALFVFLIPMVAFGVTITKPYTFVSGQPISASELNENFDVVYDRVNELGVYKVMAGSTELGALTGVTTGVNAVNFITDKGYLSGVYEFSSTSVRLGFSGSIIRFYNTSNCSDDPVLAYYNKRIVYYDFNKAELRYATDSNPTSVPGYVNFSGFCQPNTQAGSQVAADFWTTAANSESVTGMPNSISGAVSVELK